MLLDEHKLMQDMNYNCKEMCQIKFKWDSNSIQFSLWNYVGKILCAGT